MFDLQKLDWLNGDYIRSLSEDEFARRLLEHAGRTDLPVLPDVLTAAAPLVKERVATLGEGVEMLRFLLVAESEFTVDGAAAAKQLGEAGRPVVEASVAALEPLVEWTAPVIETALRSALVDGLGLKPRNAFGPVRVAVTGSTVSPPLFESMELLGHERSLRRLRAAQI